MGVGGKRPEERRINLLYARPGPDIAGSEKLSDWYATEIVTQMALGKVARSFVVSVLSFTAEVTLLA